MMKKVRKLVNSVIKDHPELFRVRFDNSGIIIRKTVMPRESEGFNNSYSFTVKVIPCNDSNEIKVVIGRSTYYYRPAGWDLGLVDEKNDFSVTYNDPIDFFFLMTKLEKFFRRIDSVDNEYYFRLSEREQKLNEMYSNFLHLAREPRPDPYSL